MICVQSGDSIDGHFKRKISVDLDKYSNWMFLEWDEHCLECSAPDCYDTCSLYCRRMDGKCRRTAYGLQYILDTEYPCVRLKFSRWGKLQAGITNRMFSEKKLKLYCRFSLQFAGYIQKKNGKKRKIIQKIYMQIRRLIKYSCIRKGIDEYDCFSLKAYSYNPDKVNLIVEFCDKNNVLVHKAGIQIKPGINEVEIDLARIADLERVNVIRVFPENNVELELEIAQMDIVSYKTRERRKVKCLIWDCDETMWKGTIAEGTDDVITKNTINIIKELDERGILQSVSSKNDEERVLKKLEESGIKEYFLYPQINWNPKSRNIWNIVKNINIGMDAVAFIDDSEFEKREVLEGCKGIRVYGAEERDSLLSYDEFNVNATSESRNRRKMYQTEEIRMKEMKEHAYTADEFLIKCQLEIDIFVPAEKNLARCAELLNRTNQFNLSQRRYTVEELQNIITVGEQKVLAYSCKDKYGEYGLVGMIIFAIEGKIIRLYDYVMSCRVAKKRIENALSRALLTYYECDLIVAHFSRTERNGILLDSLREAGYIFDEEKNELEVRKEWLEKTIVQYKIHEEK